MKVYGRRYGRDGTCVELAQHGDGRVGLWDCHRQAWRVVWGLGLNQAGFREALLDWESPNGGTLTDDGCALVGKLSRAADRKIRAGTRYLGNATTRQATTPFPPE